MKPKIAKQLSQIAIPNGEGFNALPVSFNPFTPKHSREEKVIP